MDKFNEIDRSLTFDRRYDYAHLRQKYHADDKFIVNHVADFDFATPDFINEGLVARAKEKSFSYIMTDDSYYDAIQWWFSAQKNVKLEKGWINFSYGVLFTISNIILSMSKIDDAVLIPTPCYEPFYDVTVLNGRKAVFSQLEMKDDVFVIDFADLESKIKTFAVKILIFCNPLNPSGRLWGKDELTRLVKLCNDHKVLLIVDEVHGDLTTFEKGFNSVMTLDHKLLNSTVLCSSATKLFNIGGLATSYFISPNQNLLEMIWKQIRKTWLSNSNVFGVAVMKCGYTQNGSAWVEELDSFVQSNYQEMTRFIECNHLPVRLLPMPAGFCATACFADQSVDIQAMKQLFMKHRILVRFSTDFFDNKYKWFRLILSFGKSGLSKLETALLSVFDEKKDEKNS